MDPTTMTMTNKRLETRDAEIERLRTLIQVLIDNDPSDDAADGVSVLDVWRKEARQLLALDR